MSLTQRIKPPQQPTRVPAWLQRLQPKDMTGLVLR